MSGAGSSRAAAFDFDDDDTDDELQWRRKWDRGLVDDDDEDMPPRRPAAAGRPVAARHTLPEGPDRDAEEEERTRAQAAVAFPESARILQGTRVRAFSPPPGNWKWEPSVLCADGATQADKAMAQVFQRGVGPQLSPLEQAEKYFSLARSDILLLPQDGEAGVHDLRLLLQHLKEQREVQPFVTMDVEWNTASIGTRRPRPGKQDGKIAALGLALVSKLELPSFPGVRVFVVHLPAYGDDENEALRELDEYLYENSIVGFNVKGDLTRLHTDFFISCAEATDNLRVIDVMPLCTETLGERLVSDSGSGKSYDAWFEPHILRSHPTYSTAVVCCSGGRSRPPPLGCWASRW